MSIDRAALTTTDRNVKQGGPLKYPCRVRVHCDGYFTRYASPPIPTADQALACVLGSGFEPSQQALPRPCRGKDFYPLITVMETDSGLNVVRKMQSTPFSKVMFEVHATPSRVGDALLIDYGVTFTFVNIKAYVEEAAKLLEEGRIVLAALKSLQRMQRMTIQSQCVFDRVIPREEYAQVQFFFGLFDHQGSVKLRIPIFHKQGSRESPDIVDVHFSVPVLTTSVATGLLTLIQTAAECDQPMSMPEFLETSMKWWGITEISNDVVKTAEEFRNMGGYVQSWGSIGNAVWMSTKDVSKLVEGAEKIPFVGTFLKVADILMIAGGTALDLTRTIPSAMSEEELEEKLTPILTDVAATRTASARAAKSVIALSAAFVAITRIDYRSILQRTRRSRALQALAWKVGEYCLENMIKAIAITAMAGAFVLEGVSLTVATPVIIILGGNMWILIKIGDETIHKISDEKVKEIHRVTKAELAAENKARIASSPETVQQARKVLAEHLDHGGVLDGSLWCQWTAEGLSFHDIASPWPTTCMDATVTPEAGMTF